jgi:hypothetical protein
VCGQGVLKNDDSGRRIRKCLLLLRKVADVNGKADVLSVSPPAAVAEERFSKCTCDYCGEILRFMANAEGRNAECPNCGRVVCLGAASIKPKMPGSRRANRKIQVDERSRLRRFGQFAGWLIFPLSVLALLSMVFVPIEAARPGFRGLVLLFDLAMAAAGLILMIEGKRTHKRWICSACQTDLESWHDIVCRSCGAGLL